MINRGLFYYTVHGFLQTEYDVDEDERLDTVFRLNVKGTTSFGSALIVTGTITATADGTASKYDNALGGPSYTSP